MSLLQRQILKELISVFILALVVMTVLMVFVGIIREAMEHGLGPMQIIQILPYIVPSLLPLMIPATLLLTVSTVYGRMSGDQEVVATKAAGINVVSLISPSLVMGVVLSAGSLFLTDQVIPWGTKQIKNVVVNALEDIFLDRLKTDLQFVDRKRGIAITVAEVKGNTLIMPTFSYTPHNQSTITIQAREATIKFDLEAQQLKLQLKHGLIDAPNNQKIWIEDDVFPLPLPGEVRKIRPSDLTLKQIERELKNVAAAKIQSTEHQAIETAFTLMMGEYQRFYEKPFERIHNQRETNQLMTYKLSAESHGRVALAWSCLFFVWVGSPFSIMRGNKQFYKSFFLCFTPVILVYYPLMLLIINQSKSGTIDPTFFVWIPNLILFFAGCYFFYRVRQY